MTFYIKSGNTFAVTDEANIDIRKELEIGTYMVSFHPQKGYYLTQVDDLEVKGKVYGNLLDRADRIISTFKDRPRNTGVLLQGEKGSGKTLLSKKVSEMCRALGVCTIVVNQEFTGDGFNAFMQQIDQPTVIIFDEFEKVYSAEGQEQILTLLDGVFPSKKLFMLTVNNMERVNSMMQNRPGRLFYSIEYKGLTREFIVEYCNDCLINKDHINAIANLSTMFRSFNFDMLQSLVEECNRYSCTPQSALEILNIKPDPSTRYSDKYLIEILIPGWENAHIESGNERNIYSPIQYPINLIVWESKEHEDKYENDNEMSGEEEDKFYAKHSKTILLENTNIKKMEDGNFFYELEDGTKAKVSKKPYKSYDYTDLL